MMKGRGGGGCALETHYVKEHRNPRALDQCCTLLVKKPGIIFLRPAAHEGEGASHSSSRLISSVGKGSFAL